MMIRTVITIMSHFWCFRNVLIIAVVERRRSYGGLLARQTLFGCRRLRHPSDRAVFWINFHAAERWLSVVSTLPSPMRMTVRPRSLVCVR